MALDVAMAEEQDHEALRPDQAVNGTGDQPPQYSLYSSQPYVSYEIHLHPTYQLPTLWFTLHDLPNGESPLDIDSVYRYLVPEQYKSQLRAVGVTGGISAAVSHLCSKSLQVSDIHVAPSRHRYPSFLHSPVSDQRRYGATSLSHQGVFDGLGRIGRRLCRAVDSLRNGSGGCQR